MSNPKKRGVDDETPGRRSAKREAAVFEGGLFLALRLLVAQ